MQPETTARLSQPAYAHSIGQRSGGPDRTFASRDSCLDRPPTMQRASRAEKGSDLDGSRAEHSEPANQRSGTRCWGASLDASTVDRAWNYCINTQDHSIRYARKAGCALKRILGERFRDMLCDIHGLHGEVSDPCESSPAACGSVDFPKRNENKKKVKSKNLDSQIVLQNHHVWFMLFGLFGPRPRNFFHAKYVRSHVRHESTLVSCNAPSCPATKAAVCTGGSVGHVVRPFLQTHTEFQVRFRLIRFPVVRNPLSPMAPRHSIDNWPRVARPSRLKSFCRASSPSGRASSCSTRNATCKTSRGFNVGGATGSSRVVISQFSD